MPSSPQKPAPRTYVINAEADRRLGRIALVVRRVLVCAAGTDDVCRAVCRLHASICRSVPKAILNGLSLLIVLVPFYFGIYKLFQARLEIGRERVQARAWTEAVAALEPFDRPIQRFLDHSGEAHYLLGQAYAGAGDKVRAEKARAFVRRKTGSPWAEKLQPAKDRASRAPAPKLGQR